MKYEKGMIITKKEYTEAEKTVCNLLIIFFLFWIMGGAFFATEFISRSKTVCIPISDTVCVKNIGLDIEEKDLFYKAWGIGIILLGAIISLLYFMLGTKYQLAINSQEEFDKEFPKRLSSKEERKLIFDELAQIKAMLIKRGHHK